MLKNILLLLLLLTFIHAEQTKLGIGPAVVYYPDYIGSKSNNVLAVPFPYIRYKNPYFNIDEDGLNSRLFGTNDLSIKLSLDGSLPANSENNSLREDMPDLGFTMEIGPNIIYTIHKQGSSSIQFQFPIRLALSTDFTYLEYQGLRSNPHIKYEYKTSSFEFVLRSGLILSDKEYNAYFYNVESRYVTAKRPKYISHSGFGGLKNKVSFTYKNGSWVLGAFASYYNINNAAFQSSPLVETNDAFYLGTSLSYLFYTSQ